VADREEDRLDAACRAAAEALDEHVRRVAQWHFSPETGTPFWLDWAREAGWDPGREVQGFADLMRFPHFQDHWLRDLPHERWIPRALAGRPYKVFETGGTTGRPKQRVSWEDHLTDYTEFSRGLDDAAFPPGANWLMLGPTGPRRLRLAIEHLANLRGGACYFIDLDPRWVKKLLADGEATQARRYQEHVIDQAVQILRHRGVRCLFTTPRLLESLGQRMCVPDAGITGVFCGGTSMTPQVIRFLVEEVLENRGTLVPTYGNTLMGLAVARPVSRELGFDLIYHAPQPRAVLRVVNPDRPDDLVPYGQWGRVELTTLTRELFMPRFLERDEAIRHHPFPRYPWDGVGEVRPLGWTRQKTIEGVY
jgi:phenylacetate-coenzyme A ligase PaaK-like adenylate-forming protein